MTETSAEKWRRELKEELIVAARKQELQLARPDRRAPALFVLGAAVAIVCVLVVIATRPESAAADAFVITQLDNEIRINVADPITSPEQITDQLQDELGISSIATAVPVPDGLVGSIVAVGGFGQASPETVVSTQNQVTQIVLPSGATGELEFFYGRPAEAGEPYSMTAIAPNCHLYFGRPLENTLEELQQQIETIRFEVQRADGSSTPDVDLSDIDASLLVVGITELSDQSAIVTLAPNTDHPLPNCKDG